MLSRITRHVKHSFYTLKFVSNFTNVHLNKPPKNVQEKIPKFVLSEVFVEEGKSILNMTVRFLPIYNYETNLHLNFDESIQILPETQLPKTSSDDNSIVSRNENFFYDMLNEASQQFTNRGIITLIEASPREMMTSKFCTTALTNILRIHVNRIQRDPFTIFDVTDQNLSRNIHVHQLIDRLIEIGKPEDLLTTIKMLVKNRKFLKGTFVCEKLIDQVITQIISGKYSLNQVIDAIVLFTNYIEEPEFKNNDIRSLWIGIRLSTYQILDSATILTLFHNVDSIPDVSDYIIALIDRGILDVPIKYTYTDIRKIIVAMNNIRLYSSNINHVISKWFLSNISILKENQYHEFLRDYSRNRLQEHNEYIENGLEIFMEKYNTINSPAIFVRTSNYMKQHRVVNSKILNILTKILMANINNLQPKSILEIFSTLGYLRFKIPTEHEFWAIMEDYLDVNLYKLRPELFIRILENFIYLNNYTLKFVPKLQEAEFQSIVEQLDPSDLIQLQIYDVSMAFEVSQYPGPIFNIQEKIPNVRIISEPYIVQVIDRIEDSLKKVLKKRGFAFQKFVYLDFMPQSNIYIIDVFAYPNGIQHLTISDYLRENPFQALAVLVQAPNHVQHGSKQLIGPQQMRRDHFNRLGIRTVDLDGSECLAMCFQPYLIEDYLDQLILQANIKMKSI